LHVGVIEHGPQRHAGTAQARVDLQQRTGLALAARAATGARRVAHPQLDRSALGGQPFGFRKGALGLGTAVASVPADVLLGESSDDLPAAERRDPLVYRRELCAARVIRVRRRFDREGGDDDRQLDTLRGSAVRWSV